MSFLRKTLKFPAPFRQIYRFLTTSAQYDDLINAAGREKDFTTVHHLLTKRCKDGCFTTNNTFKFIATDLSLLDDLLQALSRVDKGFARKSAYDSLIARLSKLHRPEEALRVVQEMIRNEHGANAVTFHPILIALTRKKEMEGAWRVIDLMREKGIVPDLYCYNSILTAYCFVGNLASAAEVLTRMKEEEMEADNRTYDALVLGACRAGKVDGALAIVRRQAEEGRPVLYATPGHVIGGLLERGYYAQAVELVMAYAGRNDAGLDSANFGTLASRLIDLKRVDEAVFVLGEMKKRGLPMDSKLMPFYEFHCEQSN